MTRADDVRGALFDLGRRWDPRLENGVAVAWPGGPPITADLVAGEAYLGWPPRHVLPAGVAAAAAQILRGQVILANYEAAPREESAGGEDASANHSGSAIVPEGRDQR